MQPSRPGLRRLAGGSRRLAARFQARLLRALSSPPVVVVVVAAMAAVTVTFVLHALAAPLRGDYVAMLTGARVLGNGGCLYCRAAQARAQVGLVGPIGRGGIDAFLETPVVALAFRPLLALPPAAGLALFLALSAGCVGAAGVLLWNRLGLADHGPGGVALLVLTLVSLPAAWIYQLAQTDGLLILPMVAGAVLIATHRPFAAGLLLSLPLLKPQTEWMVPVALLLVGQWRVVVGMAVGGACWAGASILLVGTAGIGQFLTLLGQQGPAVSTSDGIPGAVASLGGNGLGFLAAAVLGLIAAAWIFRRRRSLAGRPLDVLALGIAASLLLAPHVYGYDLIVVAVPLAILAQRNLAAALTGAVLLNAAYLVDTYYIWSGPHLEALALCVIVVMLAAWSRAPAGAAVAPPRAQVAAVSSTTSGA